MAKRPNRTPPLEHEQHQLDALKTMLPNTTPPGLRALSDGLIDVAHAVLDLVMALENGSPPDFEPFYARVDALADLVDSPTAPPQPSASAPPVPDPKPALAGIASMKTTIVGRPESIDSQADTVTLRMSYTPRPPASGQFGLPKGVPAPQAVATPVTVYVGKKQFDKVKPQLDNPEDSLIIEGSISQVLDGVLTVYASNITTKQLQTAKTQPQKAPQDAQA